MPRLWSDSRGQVLVLLALMLVVLLGIAALALDGGLAYGVKARMNAAADAAALAALRERATPMGTEASAATTAANYFNANFPADKMGLPHPNCSVDVTTRNGAYVATVEATTTVPTFFARVLGWRGLTLTAKSEATRSNIDVALVLDTSGSLTMEWGTVRDRGKDFVERFSEDNDRVALVPFANGVGLTDVGGQLLLTDGAEISPSTSSPRFRRTEVDAKFDALAPAGLTATEFGLRMGIYELNKVPVRDRASRRAVVLFSDGAPNTFTGVFTDTTGKTLYGNLFSGTRSTDTARNIYHAEKTADTSSEIIALLRVPSMGGGNKIGSVPLDTFKVENSKRTISYDDTTPKGLRCNANIAARNLAENIANDARSQGIVIYAIGYGSMLDGKDVDDCPTTNEPGSTILKRIANSKDSDTYNPLQPTGLFCRAQDGADLGRCYNAIFTELMRITK